MEEVVADLLRTTGPSYLTGPVVCGEALNQTGRIQFMNQSSALPTSIQAGNATAEVVYTLPTAGPAADGYFLASTTGGALSWANSAGTYAPIGSAYVTIGNDATLTNERALTGTANQVVVTDNGAGSTVVLSTPQNINSGASPTFSTINLSSLSNQFVLGATRTVTISATQPATLSRTYTFPDLSSDYSVVGTAGTQSIGGAKTFTSTLSMSGAGIAMGSQKITGLAAGSASGDALRYEQLFGGDVTLIGNLVFNPTTKGIKGTTTNDSATAGNVGEIVLSTVGATSMAATNTFGNITTISLTAGDWIVFGFLYIQDNGSAFTTTAVCNGAVSVNSANTTTDHVDGLNVAHFGPQVNNAASQMPVNIPGYHLSLASTTTVYLKAKAVYTGTTPQAVGTIFGLRTR